MLLLLLLPLLFSAALTTAQKVGQISDGQIQAPTTTAPVKMTPAPKVASAAYVPASIMKSAAMAESAVIAPSPSPANHTMAPSGKMPLHTAKPSVSVSAHASGAAGVMGGMNATAPTVPAVPSMMGGGGGTEIATEAGQGPSPDVTGAPREAGTSKPAATGGVGRVGVGGEIGREVGPILLCLVAIVIEGLS